MNTPRDKPHLHFALGVWWVRYPYTRNLFQVSNLRRAMFGERL